MRTSLEIWKNYIKDFLIMINEMDFQSVGDKLRQIGIILSIFLRQNNAVDASSFRLEEADRYKKACAHSIFEKVTYRDSFLLYSTDWKHLSCQANLARHGDVLSYWGVQRQ